MSRPQEQPRDAEAARGDGARRSQRPARSQPPGSGRSPLGNPASGVCPIEASGVENHTPPGAAFARMRARGCCPQGLGTEGDGQAAGAWCARCEGVPGEAVGDMAPAGRPTRSGGHT